MDSVVIYATREGNTREIAEAIAEALRARGAVQLLSVDEAREHLSEPVDLLVIGGPTEQHGMTEAVAQFFDRVAPDALRGRDAAAFDTRLHKPRWLFGSAAVDIAHRLRRAGAHSVGPPESFFVTWAPRLEAGEKERAAAWAASLADRWETSRPAPRQRG